MTCTQQPSFVIQYPVPGRFLSCELEYFCTNGKVKRRSVIAIKPLFYSKRVPEAKFDNKLDFDSVLAHIPTNKLESAK